MGKTILKIGGTLVSALITALLNANDIREAVSPFGYTVQWSLLTFILFLFFVGWWIGGLEFYKHRKETSKPNIVVRKKAKDEWQFYSPDGQPIYHAVQLWFVNKPRVASDDSVPEGVTAEISFYSRNAKTKGEDEFGCFTKADFPDYATILANKDLMDEIPIWQPNAIPQKLLIALKYTNDDNAYKFARSNFKVAHDGRDQAREIKKGEYYIKITFAGKKIDQPPFWFIIKNPGEKGNLSISGLIAKPDLRKEGFQDE